MTTAAHTPGPWTLGESLGKSNSYKIEGDGLSVKIYGREAFLPNGETAKVKRTEANARLVAAAPELLAACEAAMALVNCDLAERDCTYEGNRMYAVNPFLLERIVCAANAAIAKATGK